MPPKRGPLWRGEGVEEKPEGWRAGCAPVRCMHMDVHSANPGAPSRTWRAGCPEGALLGVCFFRLPFFAQAKKGDSLARRASESSALQDRKEKVKMDSRLCGNDVREKSWMTSSAVESPASAGMTSKRPIWPIHDSDRPCDK